MDQLYFEDGYYEGKYFVYTASASAGFAPYIVEGYLVQDFFEDRGSRSTVVCEITRVRFIEFDVALASAFEQTTTANKDARTTVTLSTIANVSAQALKLVPLSSSVSVVATHTASSIITASANLALTSAFAPTITANASVDPGSDITATFSLTALIGVRRQFSNFINLGIRTPSPNLALSVTPFFGVNSRFNNWTMSIWVRRDTVTGTFQPIVGTQSESSDNDAAFVFIGSNIQTRFNYDPDEPEAVWYNVAPTDGLWHHYLIRTVTKAGAYYGSNAGSASHWRLWIDGVSQGQTGGNGYQAAGQMAWNDSSTSPYYGSVKLGHGIVSNTIGGYDRVGRSLNGAVAQLWMSYVTDADFDPTDFYDGYVDFGTNGTRNGILTTPLIYTPLEPTYTDLGVGVTAIVNIPSWSGEYLKYTTTKAEFTATAQPEAVLLVVANIEAQSTLTGTIFRNRVAAAALTSTATFTVIGSKFAGVDSQLVNTASTTVISQRVRYADSAVTSAITVTSTAFRVKQFDLAVNSLATVTATAFRIQPATLTVAAQFTLTGTIDNRNRDAVSLEVGAFTLTAAVGRTRTLGSSITATCTFSIVYEVIRPAGSAMTAAFTQIATPEKRIISFGVFVVTATAVITGFRVAIAQANLQVNGFTLTQGDILNFDPCREIAVDQETRLARILPENRLLVVESETRTLRVPQETRVLKVDFETRVNIIKC